MSTACFAAVAVGAAIGHELGLLVGAGAAIGAVLGVLIDDLHERVMLGDTGANALGAVLGLSVVLTTAPTTRLVVLVGLAGVNAASELVSFSKLIDAVPPLRALDRAGTTTFRKRA